MNILNLHDVTQYVEAHIGTFHERRIRSLDSLKLEQVLRRKNPYLFRAKHVLTSEEIVRSLVDAHLSSNEETLFGEWLEGLAIFVCQKVYGGRKSGISGIDLEFDKDGTRYLVAVKSGPNWGNSSQIKKMTADFKTAAKTLRTSASHVNVVAVNGCCYGRESKPDKGDYIKLCGQRFWTFISGSEQLYLDIIEPLGHKARERNEEFLRLYAQMINKFTKQFANKFCSDNGEIGWPMLVQFNSGEKD